MEARTITRICPLCEAMCGLVLDLDENGGVRRVRGDRDDVYSKGFLCPKGASLARVESDPDRLRRPLVRRNGELVEVSWDEAFQEIDILLAPILERHGRDAVAVFLGNAMGHNFGSTLYLPTLLRAMGTRQVYSAATLDNMPHNVVAASMFGHQGSIAVPDLDHTDLLVIVGGNPLVSNGSVGAAPDYKGRLAALRERGGRLVVIDPSRTATAALADEHVAVRPGTDALLLLAMVHTLFDEGLTRLGHLDGRVAGLDALERAVASFAPEKVERRCGVAAEEVRQLARDIAAAQSAAVYGRLGTTLNPFGTLASWALQLLNVLTGHLDRPGGMMYPEPPSGSPTTRPHAPVPAPEFGRYHTRVRSAPEVFGEFPAACLAEEISTPGEGRVRALVVFGGNPARSVPDSGAMEAALEGLDALVCVDPYVNETSRFAHVLLPPPSVLTRSHYDLLLTNYSVRNAARFSEPAAVLPDGALEEWRIILRLAGVFAGDGPTADVDAVDATIRSRFVHSVAADTGRPPEELAATVRTGPEALLDLRLRTGPFGDRFGERPDGLSLDRLRAAPHGIDYGPLRPRIDEVVRTPSGRIELAPAPFLVDLRRLEDEIGVESAGLTLIGRRHLRSKNTWLHNIPTLVSGRNRCTLLLHPDDAGSAGIGDGDLAEVTSATGSLTVSVEVTDAVAPGVCSLPHGWGHDAPGTRVEVARRHAGVNSNRLASSVEIDPLSGTASLNGISVTVAPG